MSLSIIIFAMSLSMDALGVGLVYGLRKINIPLISKLIICLFSIFYAGAALALGNSLSSVLPPYMSKIIGVGILVLMGTWIIVQSLLKDTNTSDDAQTIDPNEPVFKVAIKSLGITIQVLKNPTEGDIDKSGAIDPIESLLLGLALSVDAIGIGIGSALAGFCSLFIPFAVGLFQLFFLYVGTYLGEKFSLEEKINKKVIAILPGVLLICLALIRIY